MVVLSDLLSPLSASAALACSSWLTWRAGRRGAVTSGPQLAFWAMAACYAALRAASMALALAPAPGGRKEENIWRREEMATEAIFLPAVLAALALQFFADPPPRYHGLEQSELGRSIIRSYRQNNRFIFFFTSSERQS